MYCIVQVHENNGFCSNADGNTVNATIVNTGSQCSIRSRMKKNLATKGEEEGRMRPFMAFRSGSDKEYKAPQGGEMPGRRLMVQS